MINLVFQRKNLNIIHKNQYSGYSKSITWLFLSDIRYIL